MGVAPVIVLFWMLGHADLPLQSMQAAPNRAAWV
jgi:hypothetical protein